MKNIFLKEIEEKCKGSFKDCFKTLNECTCDNTIENWQFERSSGYAGYRNKVTGEWVYEEDYFKLFPPKEIKTDNLEDIIAYFQKTPPINWEQEEEIRSLFIEETSNKLWAEDKNDAGFSEEYVKWLEQTLIKYVKKTL